MKSSSYGFLTEVTLYVKYLECAINQQLHSLCANPSNKASFFALYEMACDFKARTKRSRGRWNNQQREFGLTA